MEATHFNPEDGTVEIVTASQRVDRDGLIAYIEELRRALISANNSLNELDAWNNDQVTPEPVIENGVELPSPQPPIEDTQAQQPAATQDAAATVEPAPASEVPTDPAQEAPAQPVQVAVEQAPVELPAETPAPEQAPADPQIPQM